MKLHHTLSKRFDTGLSPFPSVQVITTAPRKIMNTPTFRDFFMSGTLMTSLSLSSPLHINRNTRRDLAALNRRINRANRPKRIICPAGGTGMDVSMSNQYLLQNHLLELQLLKRRVKSTRKYKQQPTSIQNIFFEISMSLLNKRSYVIRDSIPIMT